MDKKQNFLFTKFDKGFYGDYELFFKILSIVTGTIASDNCQLFIYDFNEYRNLGGESFILKESLKSNSLITLKKVLKRLINFYN